MDDAWRISLARSRTVCMPLLAATRALERSARVFSSIPSLYFLEQQNNKWSKNPGLCLIHVSLGPSPHPNLLDRSAVLTQLMVMSNRHTHVQTVEH